MRRILPRLGAALAALLSLHAAALEPLPDRVPWAWPDTCTALDPSQVQLHGWLGARVDANVAHRLLVVDTAPLLAGYRHKPGAQAWIGEHVGKWLDAATLAWAYTGDPALRRKLDDVAAQLIATQEPDGYLGTYLPAQRFGLYPNADWDVWTHAYNMIGLLTYYRYTGNTAALTAVRRIGDLLIATFPARRSIVAAGEHRGMAATSVLEPVVTLYRLTGDPRYLAFAHYIVGAYDDPGGPALVRSLTAGRDVSQTANGKAYEMLCNLMGLCDLARVTGDPALLKPVLNAWKNIVEHHLYLTGTSSDHEVFVAPGQLANGVDAHLGETCVTTTWIQLNLQLLQLTGRADFADEAERSLYNHLAAAQNPRGDDWCYYTALAGQKQYDADITCCHSSGPRAMTLAPTAAYLQHGSALRVSTFESSRAEFQVEGQPVAVVQVGDFPFRGHSRLTIHCRQPMVLALSIRVPAWAAPLQTATGRYGAGWAELPECTYRDGDRVEFDYQLAGRAISGTGGNADHTAFSWGPFILAAEASPNASWAALDQSRVRPIPPQVPRFGSGPPLRFWVEAKGPTDGHLLLLPFADAGADGLAYKVWLTDN